MNIYSEKIQFIEKKSQYASDFEKALDYILESKLETILITGIKGKRFDHAVSNLSIIAKYSSKIDIEIIDEDGYGFVLNSESKMEITFACPEKTIVSLLPLPKAEGIHTSGLFYPLKNEDLAFAFREGQSNFSAQEIVNIKFRSGIMIVFVLSKSCCDSPHNLLTHRGTDILNSYHKQENRDDNCCCF
jgi:thiamine pyrophosphokinase